METVPNQKIVNVKKEVCNNECRENYYAKINLNALQAAMLDLKGETLKLWLFISKNQNNYTFALSKVEALRWGIGSKSSYDRAIKELKEKGYLVETSSNHYDFYELPKEKELLVTVHKSALEEFDF